MTTQHTPAPWKVRASAQDDNIYYLWDEDENYHENMSDEEKIKNALLMEAAPELLREAKEMLSYLDAEYGQQEVYKMLPNARTIINKAEGR